MKVPNFNIDFVLILAPFAFYFEEPVLAKKLWFPSEFATMYFNVPYFSLLALKL